MTNAGHKEADLFSWILLRHGDSSMCCLDLRVVLTTENSLRRNDCGEGDDGEAGSEEQMA